MSNAMLINIASESWTSVDPWREYPVMSEKQLLNLVATGSKPTNLQIIKVVGDYSQNAFILQSVAHNHMLHDSVPPGSCVLVDPEAEVTANTMMIFALPHRNTIAIGNLDKSWDGIFISLGDRAVHMSEKHCLPLWPAKAVVGYPL